MIHSFFRQVVNYVTVFLIFKIRGAVTVTFTDVGEIFNHKNVLSLQHLAGYFSRVCSHPPEVDLDLRLWTATSAMCCAPAIS